MRCVRGALWIRVHPCVALSSREPMQQNISSYIIHTYDISWYISPAYL